MELDTVSLGRTGTQVSEVAFGTWRFGRENDRGQVEIGEDRARELLSAYAEAGGNFIDTANVYGDGKSEQWIGDWLAHRDREEFVIASKIYWRTQDDPNGKGLSRKHLRREIDRVLDRLGTDYLDLLYIHRWDEETPAGELMRTLDGFVEDGRVHYLGASTLRPNAWRVARANELARREGYEPFTVTQPRYNLVNREIEGNYLEMCDHYDLGVCPWSPLAQGFLTGKYSREDRDPGESRAYSERFADRYFTDENFDALDALLSVAEEVDATPAQVALRWAMEREGITAPIVGARTVEQLEENLEATELDLSDEAMERLTESKEPPKFA